MLGFGLLLNLLVAFAFYKGLDQFKHLEIGNTIIGRICVAFTVLLFLLSLVSFALATCLEPGFLRSAYDFTGLVNKFLDLQIHLDNLCVYCEVIKSETSFHCTVCNRCVEKYDHHCPFINQCLGLTNHKYFILFIFSYFLFITSVFVGTLWHLIVMYGKWKFACFSEDIWCTVLFVLILLHMPIVVFQILQQSKKICSNQ